MEHHLIAGPAELHQLLTELADWLIEVDHWLEEGAALREREGWTERADELRERRRESAALRRRLLAVLALLVGVALAVLWVFQRRLIYFPLLQDLPPVRSSLPGAEEVTFETADGVRLGGWFLPSDAARGPAALVFNGNAGDRSYRAPLAASLARQGWSVLLFELPWLRRKSRQPVRGGSGRGCACRAPTSSAAARWTRLASRTLASRLARRWR